LLLLSSYSFSFLIWMMFIFILRETIMQAINFRLLLFATCFLYLRLPRLKEAFFDAASLLN
jgi:hypothetical protein